MSAQKPPSEGKRGLGGALYLIAFLSTFAGIGLLNAFLAAPF
ncbi:protein of unknown function (plasmid) [Pararobbsia alpina]